MVFMLLLVALKVDERQDTSKTWQSEKEGEREKGGERERESLRENGKGRE